MLKRFEKMVFLSILAVLLIFVTLPVFSGGQQDSTSTGQGSTETGIDADIVGEIPEGKFSLDDIPPLKNTKPIVVLVESGTGSEFMEPYVKAFEKKTGVDITIETTQLAGLYTKVNMEFVGQTGAYDIAYVESSFTTDWAAKGFIVAPEDLAAEFEPEGASAARDYFGNYGPAVMKCISYDGNPMGVPFHQYTMLNVYRKDVFENEIERENFRAKYGRELEPAKSFEELQELGEFFTRKAGEKLKGETLDKDIYGMALMAGQYPHIQDEVSSAVWGDGGRWAQVVKNGAGNIEGFRLNNNNQKTKVVDALETYIDLLPYTPPGTLNAFWDFASAQFANGTVMMWPTCYADLWWASAGVEKNIPGAEIGTAVVPGGHPYLGTYYFAVTRDSGNQEAAYWFMKYIGSYGVQMKLSESTSNTSRMDVMQDEKWTTPEFKDAGRWMGACVETWKENEDEIKTYIHFTSDAFGKIYEAMMVECHEAAAGEKSAAQAIEDWEKQFVQLQSKAGEIPILD